jgi:hypothetical protein
MQPDGAVWLQAGENARAGEKGCFHYPGTPGNVEGPYLTWFGREVACFWRRIPNGDLVWSTAVPVRVKVKSVHDREITLDAGLERGIKVDCNAVLETEGKTLAILTILNVEEGRSTAAVEPSPGGSVEVDDELVALTWSPAAVILEGKERSRSPRPHSVATDTEGVPYLAAVGGRRTPFSKVLRFDADKDAWVEDSPPGLEGRAMLASWGPSMVCVWQTGGAIVLSLKPKGGAWRAAKKVADEPLPLATLAMPQIAPDEFLPLAWGNRGGRTVRLVAVPAEP